MKTTSLSETVTNRITTDKEIISIIGENEVKADINVVLVLIPIRRNVRSVLTARVITIRMKRVVIVRNVLLIIPVSIIEKTEANNVLTVPVITMGSKAKAAIARNVLRIVPVIIRMRMANNVRIVRAIITGSKAKAVIVLHVHIIAVKEVIAVRKEDVRVPLIIIQMRNTVRRSRWSIRKY